MSAMFFVTEPLVSPFDISNPTDALLSRAADTMPALRVINGNWDPLSLLFLAVTLFLVLAFLRLAEVAGSFDCITRLAVAEAAASSLPLVSFGVGRKSSSQSTSRSVDLGCLGLVSFNRGTTDPGSGKGAFGFWRPEALRLYPAVAGLLVVIGSFWRESMKPEPTETRFLMAFIVDCQMMMGWQHRMS
jgi:hypothetical protein